MAADVPEAPGYTTPGYQEAFQKLFPARSVMSIAFALMFMITTADHAARLSH